MVGVVTGDIEVEGGPVESSAHPLIPQIEWHRIWEKSNVGNQLSIANAIAHDFGGNMNWETSVNSTENHSSINGPRDTPQLSRSLKLVRLRKPPLQIPEPQSI